MTSLGDLRSIIILSHLTEEMLAQLLPIISMQIFEEEDVIFRQGEIAERFYMLRRGKVLLEQQIVDKVTVVVGAIEPGYSFGWSAMLAGGVYSADAVCAEPCEVFSFSRQEIDVLIEQTPALGLRLYRRLLVVLKKRFDYRTEQFRLAIMNHPDLKRLFSD